MKKFLILLQKETRELLTLQVILPLLVTVVIFMGIGNVMNKEQKKVESGQVISVIDKDSSVSSSALVRVLKDAKFKVKDYSDITKEDAIKKTRDEKGVGVLVIPQGFEEGMRTANPKPVEMYSITRNFSFTGVKGYETVKAALAALNTYFSDQMLAAKIPEAKPEVVKNPIQTTDYVVIGERMAKTSPEVIMGFVSQQTTFIPIILFFVIVFASQMIATAVATEKENKTLETLLSVPVSRTAIVASKMLAAGLVALVSSGFYMVGFRSYITGLSGGAFGSTQDQVAEAANQLGLTLEPLHYVALGAALFCGILVALAISIILGAFAEDVKSLQGLLSPLMFLVMIPYLMVLLLDISSVSPVVRYAIYAIPFSHSFLAAPDLFLHNYAAVAYGIAYQFAIFLILLWIAARIFATDRIVTMKLNWGKKPRS